MRILKSLGKRGRRPKGQPRDSRGRFAPRRKSVLTSLRLRRAPALFRSKKKPRTPKKAGSKNKGQISVTVKSGRGDAVKIKENYEKVLATNFTEEERKKLLEHGVDITVEKLDDIPVDPDEEVLGGYFGTKRKRHQISIKPNQARSEGTLTHETLHAIQECDEGRPKIERELTLEKVKGDNDRTALKEALTEAETLSRCKEIPSSKGYYDNLDNKESQEIDWKKIRSGKLGKSSRHVDNTYNKFNEMEISELRINESAPAKVVKKNLKEKESR